MARFLTDLFNAPRRGALLANLVLLAIWGWLFHPVYGYLAILFTRQEFRTNQVVLLGVLALIGIQVRRGQFSFPLGDLPRLYLPALVLALAGAGGFVAAEHWLDVNTLSATLFGLASYGLLGLWLAPARWRAGLPAALLLIGVLPFGEHMETFIGYPLRLATAQIVSHGLAALRVPNLGVDTILIFENGLSQVDSPCSGVKSLWTGGLFLLAATWIEGRAINRRWLLAALTFGGLLLAANAARVFLLVLAGPVAGMSLLAEMLHVPLGVIGFTVACLAAALLLRWVGGRPLPAEDKDLRTEAPPRPRWLAPALIAVLAGLALLYAPRPKPAAAASVPWQLPPQMSAQEWPLSAGEQAWLSEDGSIPAMAARWRFTAHDLSGSLLLVASDTWRAQHRPERCFTVYGLEVQESRLHLVTPDFPIRWLTLGGAVGDRPLPPAAEYTAAYWLQSRERVTDDYAARIWDDLAPQPQTWVLVTLLFDKPVNLSGPETQALLRDLRAAIGASLATGR